jgi:hypothetical protein
LYFLGLHFQYAASSSQIHGVARDAEYVVRAIGARQPLARESRDGEGRKPRADPRQVA